MKLTQPASRQRLGSLARKVCIFVSVLLIAVTLIMTLVGFLVGREIVRQQVHERLRIIAAARQEFFSSHIDQQLRRMGQYASRNRLRRAVQQYPEDPEVQRATIERMLSESKEQFVGIFDAWVTDPKGIVIASTDVDKIGQDLSSDESFIHGLERPFIAAPQQRDDLLASDLTAPIVDSEMNPVGVLYVLHDMESLRQMVRDRKGLGMTGDILVTCLEGDHLSYFFPTALKRPESVRQASVLRMAIDDRASLEAVQTRFGDDIVLATYQPIDLQQGVRRWGMIAKINASEAYAPVYRFAKLLLLFQAVMLILVWAATQWLARRFMSPLDRLTEVVSQFAAGQRHARAEAQSEHEFAALGDAFNSMADAVLRTEQELEHRVQQRTAELQYEIDTRKEVQSQLMEARDVAEKANRSKSQFLANMSHEIRTPMNGILGMAQLLEAGDLRPEQQSQLVAMQQCAQWLLQLLNDILDFSKIEAGMLSLEKVPFDFRSCVDSTIATLAVRGFDKDLEFVCRIAPDVPHRTVSDPGRLRQILFNLIGNAIKFTDHGHVFVDITCRELEFARAELTICVADTGIGIAAENLDHIFDAFRQAEPSTSRDYGGTGLGLSISSQLISAMDGHITVESEPGVGSTFRVTLPMRYLPVEEVDERPLTKAQGAVLIVESKPKSLEVATEMVESLGAKVVAVRSAAEAIPHLVHHHISLVLLSDDLDDLPTQQCVESIRAVPESEAIPIAIMHGAYTPDQLAGWAALHVGHLSKPLAHQAVEEFLMLHLLGAKPQRDQRDTQSMINIGNDQPVRILLVEDSLVNQQVALGLLQRLNCDVQVATHGREAIQMTEAEAFDVVLMDVQMPVMDGIEATIAIREREASGGMHLPIIAMTAAAMKGDRQRCFDAGMDGYISKPVTHENLISELMRVLGSDGARIRPRRFQNLEQEEDTRPERRLHKLSQHMPG
ncbi:MAG: response regulator [Pirellulaceae bacterium]